MDSVFLFPDIAITDAKINLPGDFFFFFSFLSVLFISIFRNTSFSLGNVERASLAVCRAFAWKEYKVFSLKLRVFLEMMLIWRVV